MNKACPSFADFALVFAVILVAGCDAPAPMSTLGALDCSPLMACGGKLEGSWVLRGQCGLAAVCGGAAYDYSKANTVVTFTGSKMGFTGAGSASASIPLSCWAQDAGSGSCASLNSRAGYTCKESGATCACAIDFSRVYEGVPPASFILSGTQLLVGNATYSYCVFGNVLRMAVDNVGADLGPVFEYTRR